jgi:hypothetical protein
MMQRVLYQNVRNQATVGVYIRGGEHGVLGSIYKEEEEER